MYQEQQNAQHFTAGSSTHMQGVVDIPSAPSYHLSQSHQVDLSTTLEGIDTNLLPHDDALLAPCDQVPQPSYDAIARHFQEQPWSASNPRTTSASGHGHGTSLNPAREQYGTYRDSCPSIERSDSAYYSQPQTAHSVLSNGSEYYAQLDLPSSITLQVQSLDVGSSLTDDHAMIRSHSNARSQISNRSSKSGKTSKNIPCPHPDCTEVSKCKSDFKYVQSFSLLPTHGSPPPTDSYVV